MRRSYRRRYYRISPDDTYRFSQPYSKFTMLERERIIGSLAEGHALITMDYSHKFLSAWHVESQKLYYGKKGLSWHVSHVLANISGTYVEHNFVHLLNHETQVCSRN